ncbi:hypothetical protein VFPFJ_05372 [Purpureocillium lilacinum]|uniref:Uncharacterized protein n=1 Tax=Purpureocillium lilacinum TaxID=33203 RepID=A0A179HPF0_PURLI|nr:hypothetical protein VFPFJ_05372 [Purpureocillium lilacinum]OAQ91213.1 hypothetical protein VFPFJ_05372 [Purpureocillium lilacinum]
MAFRRRTDVIRRWSSLKAFLGRALGPRAATGPFEAVPKITKRGQGAASGSSRRGARAGEMPIAQGKALNRQENHFPALRRSVKALRRVGNRGALLELRVERRPLCARRDQSP